MKLLPKSNWLGAERGIPSQHQKNCQNFWLFPGNPNYLVCPEIKPKESIL